MKRRMVLVAGKTGSGKSYYVNHEILPILPRVLILDVQGEYTNPAYVVVHTSSELREALISNIDKDRFGIVLRAEDEAVYEVALELARAAGNLAIVIEEAANFSSPSGYMPALNRMIRYGRHTSVSVIGVSQRLTDFGPLWLNNADLLVCFQTSDRNDIERLRSIGWVNQNDIERVSQLKVGESVHFWNVNQI